jgi:hypothetical protein
VGDEEEVLRDGALRAPADVEGEAQRREDDARLLPADGDALHRAALDLQPQLPLPHGRVGAEGGLVDAGSPPVAMPQSGKEATGLRSGQRRRQETNGRPWRGGGDSRGDGVGTMRERIT